MKTRSIALAGALLLASCGAETASVERPELMPGASPFAYPISLWDAREQGETELMVHVTALGEVDSAYVHGSSGFAAFDSAALAGARALRFTPARQGDLRVPMWTRVPVRFSLDSTAAKAAAVGPDGATP
jgi:TonB family protein